MHVHARSFDRRLVTVLQKGDYFIEYKLAWRRSFIMLGALLGQTFEVLRS